MVNAEGGLLLLALLLYVFDSALLLASNEWTLEGRGEGWRARFGQQSWKLGGREPLLPNLLTPWRPLLRVGWRFETGLSDASSIEAKPASASVALRFNATLLLVLVFVALPLALFVYPQLALKLGVAGAIYLACLFGGLLLWRERAALGLSAADCAKLGIECIACPPFAINIVRKLSLRSPALDAAQALRLAPDQTLFARAEMLSRLREQIDFEPEGTPRMARLLAVAATLEPQP